MSRQIGIEPGNYDTKLVTRDKKIIGMIEQKHGSIIEYEDGVKAATLGVINAVSSVPESYKRRRLGASDKKINLLDVTIETNDTRASGRWFVGGLAIKERSGALIKPTSEDEKCKNPMTIVMMLTTLAYTLLDEMSSETTQSHVVSIGTLLPTEEFFESDGIDQYKAKIVGDHTIKFNDPTFGDKIVRLKINDDIELKPEGAAGQLALAYGWDGEISEEYADATVLCIDIGSIDVDVSIMEEGVFNGFFGLKGGTINILTQIRESIKELGKTMDIHQIDYVLRNNKDLKIGTKKTIKSEELKTIQNDHSMPVARVLANEITQKLNGLSFNKNDFNVINLIGGGPIFFEAGMKQYYETDNINITVPKHARIKNAEGALKGLLAQQILNTKSSAEEEIYE